MNQSHFISTAAILLLLILNSCAQTEGNSPTINSINGQLHPINGDVVCTVDSTIYNRPYHKKSTGKKFNFLKDGSEITMFWRNDRLIDVTIDGRYPFNSCSKDGMPIRDENDARILLTAVNKNVTDDELNRFVDLEIFACHTIDEDIFFIPNGEVVYVGGFGGPSPSYPTAYIGMSAKILPAKKGDKMFQRVKLSGSQKIQCKYRP